MQNSVKSEGSMPNRLQIQECVQLCRAAWPPCFSGAWGITGSTTRAQLAVPLRRLSVFVEQKQETAQFHNWKKTSRPWNALKEQKSWESFPQERFSAYLKRGLLSFQKQIAGHRSEHALCDLECGNRKEEPLPVFMVPGLKTKELLGWIRTLCPLSSGINL